MSQNASTPRPEDRGETEDDARFVGGEFGHSDNTEDGHLTSAQQEGAEREQEAHLADPDQSASTTQESVVDPSGTQTWAPVSPDAEPAFDDVEGIGTEPSPGDRNEPL